MRTGAAYIVFNGLCILQTVVNGQSSPGEATVTRQAAPELPHDDKRPYTGPGACKNDSLSDTMECPGSLWQSTRRLSLPVEVSGDRLSLEWAPGDDLWGKAKEFRQGHGLMAPPDCAGKKTVAELEFCTDDHLVMFMQREMMTRELQARLESGNATQGEGWFDFESLFAGTGGRYSHYENYIFFRGVLERHAELLPVAIEMLRACVQREPRFAPTVHTLTNALYDLYLETGDDTLLQETARWLDESLAEGTRREEGEAVVARLSRCPPASSSPLHVVTVASHEKPALQMLRASVEAVGLNLTVLGLGQPWRGLGSKVFLLQDHLASRMEGGSDCHLLAFVDAYDVLFLPPAAQLAQRYEQALEEAGFTSSSSNAAVVFSAETACSPDKGMRALYSRLQGDGDDHQVFRYLNSGTYLGRVGSVRHMLSSVLSDLQRHHGYSGADVMELDDQRWFTRYLFREPGMAVLDRRALVFHTLFQLDTDDFDFDGGAAGGGQGASSSRPGALTSRVAGGTQPCILHGNGGAFKQVFDRLRQGGWPPCAPGTPLVQPPALV